METISEKEGENVKIHTKKGKRILLLFSFWFIAKYLYYMEWQKIKIKKFSWFVHTFNAFDTSGKASTLLDHLSCLYTHLFSPEKMKSERDQMVRSANELKDSITNDFLGEYLPSVW